MRRRIVLPTLAAAGLLTAGQAWAGNGQTVTASLLPAQAPALGGIVTGSGATLTTFTVNASTGAVSAAGGNAIRVKGTASVTPATQTLTCTAGNGTGNDCTVFKSIAITITAGNSTGGRTGTITGFTVAQVSGAGAPTSVTTTSNPATLNFTLPATGSTFSASQTVKFNIGLSIQYANTGSGLDVQTLAPYTVGFTWQ